MDWGTIVTQIILGVIGLVISALGTVVTYWITTKIKDQKLRDMLLDATDVVRDAVTYVYQTYVENLKGTSAWNEEAMKIANQKAVDYITKNLPANVKEYFNRQGTNLQDWILEQIEIAVQNNKTAE